MAIVKKTLHGPSIKHPSETVIPPSRAALFLSIHISITNSVKYSRSAGSSYEQYNFNLETPLTCLYVVFKLHIASKVLLDSACSVAIMAAC